MATATQFILALPTELIIRISDFLNTESYGKLRLSCKSLNNTVFDTFAKEFFTKRQFMLEQVSLDALVGISKHPALSKRLSEVIISTHVLSSRFEGDNKSYVSQDVLLSTGQALHMLVEAFTNLTHLKTVGLRDFDGLGRVRDGEFARWRTYGWFTPGMPPAHSLATVPPSPIFSLLLFALGKAMAGRSGPFSSLNLEVILRKQHRLEPQALNVLANYMGSTTKPVLIATKRLFLALDSTRLRVIRNVQSYEALGDLLRHTPNLEHLRLNFTHQDVDAEDFLKFLGEDGNTRSIHKHTLSLPSPPLTNLQSLDLGMVPVKPDVLIQIILRFRLKSLALWKIGFPCDSLNAAHLPVFRDFAIDLGCSLPASTALKKLDIGFMTQCFTETLGERDRYENAVHFANDGDPANRVAGNTSQQVTFEAGNGASVHQWLREIAERSWVQEDAWTSGSSGDDISDYDDDEEDESLDHTLHGDM
ncbi:hypothetical protein LTR62_005471 [Meristemomyces frigidus]|uniref:F-box domain-containing protein n=1 Tax=Meristemomyces frigidus TaxID=1508187 RepID=A0AAN7TFD3_9PEZI|nr:hypothetical protein LTR62_005471 [Meristemomyces frigidus]